ncbi:hypothetical protein FRC11_001410, partial [Ceratobasidium sp. 423]
GLSTDLETIEQSPDDDSTDDTDPSSNESDSSDEGEDTGGNATPEYLSKKYLEKERTVVRGARLLAHHQLSHTRDAQLSISATHGGSGSHNLAFDPVGAPAAPVACGQPALDPQPVHRPPGVPPPPQANFVDVPKRKTGFNYVITVRPLINSDEEERTALVDALRTLDERQAAARPSNSTTTDATDADFYYYTPAVCRALERHFWRNCGLGKDPMYGADMQGTLFDPEMKTWNVACLPNLLERVMPDGERIPSVNTPYLYFGMWRAPFAWHVEDMDLYSINYIHWGAPKYWYAIPSQRAEAFEATMRKHFPTEVAECPQFMRHKSFLASPAILAEADCRPNTLVHHQGEFVITYPRGYHAGLNIGFNCAESVNFALESWIELGKHAQFCKCVGDSVRFDVEAILADYETRVNPPLPRFDDYPSPPKRKSHPTDEPLPKRIRIREPEPPFATAAQLEQLPTIKIKIRPPAMLAKGSDSPYRARTQPISTHLPRLTASSSPPQGSSRSMTRASPTRSTASQSSKTSGASFPRLRLPVQEAPPCYLCPSEATEGLLPVRESSAGESTSPTRRGMGAGSMLHALKVHGSCAEAVRVPEMWIALIGGQKYVCGVKKIVKDRWTLVSAEP